MILLLWSENCGYVKKLSQFFFTPSLINEACFDVVLLCNCMSPTPCVYIFLLIFYVVSGFRVFLNMLRNEESLRKICNAKYIEFRLRINFASINNPTLKWLIAADYW